MVAVSIDAAGPVARLAPPLSTPRTDAVSLAEHVRHWAAVRPDMPALTMVDYPADSGEIPAAPDGQAQTLTWAELDARVDAVAARLIARGRTGERVAILAPQGFDYVTGFLGCLRAGAVAVPLFPPGLPEHRERLRAVLDSASVGQVLTAAAHLDDVRRFLVEGSLPPPEVLALDRPEKEPQAPPPPVATDPADVAYLQYTSGSTRTPAGVAVTHANAVANARQALAALGAVSGREVAVSWLPLFHDMGLMLGLTAPVVGGHQAVLMQPKDFVQRPVRWLQVLSQYPAAVSAAPNFAYDHCVQRLAVTRPRGVRLDRVTALLNGGEPVRAETMTDLREVLGRYGLRGTALRSAYGLAEATVMVAVSSGDHPATVTTFDRDRLAAGHAVPVASGRPGLVSVSCGAPVAQEVAVVDPAERLPLDAGRVGEIWVHGPNVAAGYHGDEEGGTAVFGAELAQPRGLPTGPWLRTGDLGTWHQGRLYVVGRLKELIIIDGRNHHPHDIEATVAEAHPLIRRSRVAVFSVPAAEEDATERTASENVVVVVEYAPSATLANRGRERGEDWMSVTRAIRSAVHRRHGLPVHEILPVPRRTIPLTTSAKPARGELRDRYRDGSLHLAANGWH